MQLTLLLFLTLGAVTVQADLLCLDWGLWTYLVSPLLGIVCHFKPDVVNEAEDGVVNFINETIQSGEQLVKFDLTHNPAVVAYNFVREAEQGQGTAYLRNITRDFGNVGIGFTKETTNTVVTIYDLAHWNDVSYCLVTGAFDLAAQVKRKSRKRTGLPAAGEVKTMVQDCVSDKFKQIAHAAVFNVTGPNQQIGATISDLSASLVPIAIDLKLATEVTEGAVDLGIRGSEDATRIMKNVAPAGADGVAQNFVSEAEAETVATKLEDPAWMDENCGFCALEEIVVDPVDTSKKSRRGRPSLQRRGNTITCCRAPTIVDGIPVVYDVLADEGDHVVQPVELTTVQEQLEATDPVTNPIFDSQNYGAVSEASLVPPPDYLPRNMDIVTDITSLNNDLETLNTAVVAFRPELTEVMSSDDVFTFFRKAFKLPETDPLFEELDIDRDANSIQSSCRSNWFMISSAPELKPIQRFVNLAIQQGVDTAARLKGLPTDSLVGFVDFFYTEPSEAAAFCGDKGFDIEGGILQMRAADTPGLVIQDRFTGLATRPPVSKNTWQVTKGVTWDANRYLVDRQSAVTWHTTFGPEMAKDGRVSMVMFVKKKGWRF